MAKSMIKGRGHNYWWLRRGDDGRFRRLNETSIWDLYQQQAAYYTYAESLVLELVQTFEGTPTVKGLISNNLEGRPPEVYEVLRTFCIENGLIRPCPDCNGMLQIQEDRRCQTCEGKGWLNC